MTLPSFKQWLIALIVCAGAIAFCVWFVDLPFALFVHRYVGAFRPVDHLLSIVVLFIPLGVLSMLVCGCLLLARRPVPRWAVCFAAAGFSVCGAIAINYFLLQPMSGRLAFSQYLAFGHYGFVWLHGRGGMGFPSGHATLTASFLVVFWLFYPRLRAPLAVFIALEGAGLVLMNWHFVSDVLGGLFLGSTAAIMTCALFEKARPAAH